MHFIVGGAFQGKRKWAKQYYELDNDKPFLWCNGYEAEWFFPDENMLESIIIFEGLEALIRRSLSGDLQSCRSEWRNCFEAWCNWEKKQNERRVIWIGCDISQGIVPLQAEERNWRDVTGWCYQDLTNMCDRVDRVWCGLVERMK